MRDLGNFRSFCVRGGSRVVLSVGTADDRVAGAEWGEAERSGDGGGRVKGLGIVVVADD